MRTVKNGRLILTGENLEQTAFPVGGLGAGNFMLSGSGMPLGFSLRNSPDYYNDPNMIAAVYLDDGETKKARVLEGKVPDLKIFGGENNNGEGHGDGTIWSRTYGLPRFSGCEFVSHFPFADVKLTDESVLVEAVLTAWSPFIPADPDDSGLPCGILSYTLTNRGNRDIKGVFYFASENIMRQTDNYRVTESKNGYTLIDSGSEAEPWKKGALNIRLASEAKVDAAWFRGGWFDSFTMLWNYIQRGEQPEGEYPEGSQPSPGGSLSAAFSLSPGESVKYDVMLTWYVPESDLRAGEIADEERERGIDESLKYKPYYSARFSSVLEAADYLEVNLCRLYRESAAFSESFYSADIPSEIKEAIAANLSILKSPTVLRQSDGRLWCWEGSMKSWGSCHGSCTHVWNYAQAIPHLFPSLERTLRETEFLVSQNEEGHQTFRSNLPICKTRHTFHAASDGQLGGIMKLWRDYLICGDVEWLKKLYPAAVRSIEYCIRTWDPDEKGLVSEPHHNTYDIEFWGPDGMCSSFYIGALKAMSLICGAVGVDGERYLALYKKGREKMESELFNGEYFIQKIEWKKLHASVDWDMPEEERKRLDAEGPKYQYGDGCVSDGVLGAWIALQCGVGEILDPAKVESHLLSVYKYNMLHSFSRHSNTQRPGYASAQDGGLILASWPHGDKLSLPFVYSDEVWTGIEYQVASHLIAFGHEKEGLDIVSTLRKRYDGKRRNPFDEYECGHFYARALASYALLYSYSGVCYDAASKTLFVKRPSDSRKRTYFLSTASGYMNVTMEGDKVVSDKPELIGSIQIV